MKKEWINPEVKNLAVENTNEVVECNIVEEYSPQRGWRCLTHGGYFSTHEELLVHIEEESYHEIRRS